jgi:CheY-like chemotaxis protein
MLRRTGILLVEDCEDDVFLFRRAWSLAWTDIPLTDVRDGGAAIHVLGEAGRTREEELPALVLTDLKMPGSSGFDLMRFIREEQSLAGLPVLVWSNSSDPEDVRQAQLLGARCFFPKPTSQEEWRKLILRVRECYDEVRAEAALQKVVAESEGQGA